jgi:hypothetical protein
MGIVKFRAVMGRLTAAMGALAGVAALLTAACVAGEDAVSAQLTAQTRAFSDASLRGDSTAINNAIDSTVIFSPGNGDVQGDPNQADAVSALLKRETQALIDARLRGDAATIQRLTDAALVSTNEDGLVSGQRELLRDARAGAMQEPAPVVTMSAWVLHDSDGAAVATYVGDAAVHYGAQVREDRFRAIDIWIKRGADWTLIASQSIPLQQDPPALALSSDRLDAYVGSYAAPGGVLVTIARAGDALTATLAGAKAVPLEAELHDVFFTPGSYGARKIFERDASGQITGYINRSAGGDLAFTKIDPANAPHAPAAQPATTLTPTDVVVHHTGNLGVVSFVDVKVTTIPGGTVLTARYRSTETWIKRGASWKMMASQTLNLRPDPPAQTLRSDVLHDYVGTYTAGPGLTVVISQAGSALVKSINGGKAMPLAAELQDVLFTPGQWRTRLIVQRDASGHVTGYLSRRDGRDILLSKVQ